MAAGYNDPIMFDHLGLPALFIVFVGAAVAVWIAGIHLSTATDILSSRWKLGEALGGLILLAIVTNLPEIAITVSGALSNHLEIAVGNILGGIALQTVVLVVLDIFGVGKEAPLTYRAASLTLVLEGILVMAILGVTVMGTQLPANLIFLHMTPESVAITVFWLVGLWLVGKSRKDLPWQDKGNAPDGQAEPRGHSRQKKFQKSEDDKISTARALTVFLIGSLVTLACGVALEQSGEGIAKYIGLNEVLFGATLLGLATSLPEISTGLASVKMGDYRLAISDIFGGNAFLPVLFLMATLISGKSVLPQAQKTDIYLTALGILLTTVYVVGLIFRPKRQVARMGIDSLIVLALYGVGVAGLFAIAQK